MKNSEKKLKLFRSNTKPTLRKPTKRSLIEFLEKLPLEDDAPLQISVNTQDIVDVKKLWAFEGPKGEMGIDFIAPDSYN